MAYQMCREYHSWMYEKWPGLFRDLSKQRICKDTLKQRICRGISQDLYFVGPIFFSPFKRSKLYKSYEIFNGSMQVFLK